MVQWLVFNLWLLKNPPDYSRCKCLPMRQVVIAMFKEFGPKETIKTKTQNNSSNKTGEFLNFFLIQKIHVNPLCPPTQGGYCMLFSTLQRFPLWIVSPWIFLAIFGSFFWFWKFYFITLKKPTYHMSPFPVCAFEVCYLHGDYNEPAGRSSPADSRDTWCETFLL